MQEKEVFLTVKDHSVSGEEFKLIYNAYYDLLKTHPQPSPEKLPKYYESEDYISHTDASSGIFNKTYQFVKKYMLRKKVRLVNKHTNGKSLLDLGAGTGDFLATAKKQNFTTTGVEPNSTARNLATEKGIDLHASKDALDEKFDAITLWHVFEHLADFKEEAKWLAEHLEENGCIVIAVPNYRSYDAKKYKSKWAAYDVPRHLYHFSEKSIRTIFSEVNFALVDVKPMWFDSFYVSILSEKYENSKFSFVKGIFSGLRSNISALSTGEASSHIYILKKRV